ncbi:MULTISPECIES: MurR/RpiR family transcriptional regulator [Nocardia]|uniref:MurR/RpiR family transcriptional regulator n=1 Tax=Nocardia implantans TaxID=3108168 RepID=A0ABU6B3M4_9NOCA|nr:MULTISPECIES: MurR/RpiR family transcriptional regulator [unclassified Nocardia]MBF6195981.1 MurR/RpiR family transcriptional regulator [Nocardia beijingensis]MEA3532284.1 MurR/RpiR family transcriptional regulator [Nocardia sp. CDC192]MEB3514321.1 MurR/RpiR family transcriptional regulator [Nocardia sp. CDC186]
MGANAESATGPATFDDLVGEIRARWSSLSASHKKLAERVLSDPEAVAFMTVSDLASAVAVNEATVVRFANGLGLKGYPGLARLCQERLREQAQLLRRFENLEHLMEQGAGLRERQVVLDQANIARSFAGIADATWDAVATQLARAPRVHVMGLRKCHAPAYLLGYLLGLLREDVASVTGTRGSLTDELRRVRPGDCFVALSIHRYSLDTVRAAQWARRRGAHVVALTDTPVSPLAAAAHETFYVEASSASVLRSMTAFTSIVQAMSGAVAHLLGHEVRETLLEEERLLDEFGVYAADGD